MNFLKNTTIYNSISLEELQNWYTINEVLMVNNKRAINFINELYHRQRVRSEQFSFDELIKFE